VQSGGCLILFCGNVVHGGYDPITGRDCTSQRNVVLNMTEALPRAWMLYFCLRCAMFIACMFSTWTVAMIAEMKHGFFRFAGALCLLAALAISACSPGAPLVQYVGHRYEAVPHTDLYLDGEEIDRPYRVMGRLQADARAEYRAERMQDYIMKYAAERGAHAVIIESLDFYEDDPVHETRIIEKKREDVTDASVTISDSLVERKGNDTAKTRGTSTMGRNRSSEAGASSTQKTSSASGSTTERIGRTSGEATTSTTIRETSYRPRRIGMRAVLIRYE
jgi:hypothetical protein